MTLFLHIRWDLTSTHIDEAAFRRSVALITTRPNLRL